MALHPRDEELWGFQLEPAINRGFTPLELERLSSPLAGGQDLELPSWLTLKGDWKSEHYSFGRLYRKWLNWPRWLPLPFSGDHGWEQRLELLDHELQSHWDLHFTFSEERALFNRGEVRKEVLLVPHPWITFCNENEIRMRATACGTILFIPHESDVAKWEPYDWEAYRERVETNVQLPDLRAVCLMGHDVLRGRHHDFAHWDLPLVTAGDPSSPYFVERFFSLVTHFSSAASCSAGSEILYLTHVGLDYWCSDSEPPRLLTEDRSFYLDGRCEPKYGSRAWQVEQETLALFHFRRGNRSDRLEFVGRFLGYAALDSLHATELRTRLMLELRRHPVRVSKHFLSMIFFALRKMPKLMSLILGRHRNSLG